MSIKTYIKTSSAKLSEHFRVREFACKGSGCCKEVKIDEKLVDYLQKIRNHFGKSLTINSAYRCATHNKKVGGASKSNHTKGSAADIVVKGVNPLKVARYAESIGIKGIGLYDTFVHIDTRKEKFFWYSSKQEPLYTFGGACDKKKEAKADENVLTFQKAAIADGFKLKADGIWGKDLTKLIQKAVGIKADGKFGADTKAAVIKWQKRLGLTADGVVGYNTWIKLLGL